LYDLILVANGNHSLLDYKRSLRPDGICVLAGGGSGSIFGILAGAVMQWWLLQTQGRERGSFLANVNPQDLAVLKELLETGKVKPVIDRRYPLSETAAALRYLGEGHANGKVVITVE